jgi:hypothetical protein
MKLASDKGMKILAFTKAANVRLVSRLTKAAWLLTNCFVAV